MGFAGGKDEKLRIIFKKLSETISSDTTLTDDDDLQFEAEANVNYAIFNCRFCNSHAAADLKERFSIPAGATINRINSFWHGGGGCVPVDFAATLTSFDLGVAEMNPNPSILIMGATAGTVAYQWAQNGTTSEDTTLLAGSFLWVMKANGN